MGNFEKNYSVIFRKLRGKKIKISFLGSVFDAEKYGQKIFRHSNFSDFLGIKSEINQLNQRNKFVQSPRLIFKLRFGLLYSDL